MKINPNKKGKAILTIYAIFLFLITIEPPSKPIVNVLGRLDYVIDTSRWLAYVLAFTMITLVLFIAWGQENLK